MNCRLAVVSFSYVSGTGKEEGFSFWDRGRLVKNVAGNMFILMRPKQWVKNVFIFFPLLFSGEIYNIGLLADCVLAFIGFSFVASSVYILNDCFDVRQDIFHPLKAHRASVIQSLKRSSIAALIGLCAIAGLTILYGVGVNICLLALFYIALFIVYNYYAKKIVLLDVFIIAVGFQIRIWIGSLAAGVEPSAWLQMCVFLLALFLGFAKRRYEITALKDNAVNHRGALAHYTAYLLDQIIIICSTLSIVFYGLYAISGEVLHSDGNYHMVYSVVFVIYGIFRYLYLIHIRKLGGDPGQILFADMPLMVTVVLWILYCIKAIYFL